MLVEVFSGNPTFKNIRFRPGLNVVVAERREDSGERQSRNGLGKSTLLEIVHFCLGADAGRSSLNTEDLGGWDFGLRFLLPNRHTLEVQRALRHPNTVKCRQWDLTQEPKEIQYSNSSWTKFLGENVFGLVDPPGDLSFRNLIAYFARRGGDAYLQPFDLVRKQKTSKAAVRVAFLLGLNWQDVHSMESIHAEQKRILDERKSLKLSEGKLTDLRLRLERQLHKESEALESFRVHPQYAELEAEASRLTREIQKLSEESIREKQKIDHYRRAVTEEAEGEPLDVEHIFAEANILLSTQISRTLEEARSFHKQVIENRKKYLDREIREHEHTLQEMERRKRQFIDLRAELMEVLRSHGALQEYQKLRERTSKIYDELAVVKHQLKQLQDIEERALKLQRRKTDTQERTRQNFHECTAVRDLAVAKFAEYAERLYEGGGSLVLELGNEAQFRFDASFQNDQSQSVGAMKVFCFDLVLATLWAQQQRGPGFLFHDSMIFDGVDERQKAKAIELASQVSLENGFQYVCTINSDQLPTQEFSSNFDFKESIVAILQDGDPKGKLLGIQFETRQKLVALTSQKEE